MADPIANPESLATLSAMVNQTLVETGRFFRSSGSVQSRNQLKRGLPSTHEQFQSALDSLSEQIFIAKAFLEQDYETAKAKRAALATPQPVLPEKQEGIEDIPMQEAPTIKQEPSTANAAVPQSNDQPPAQQPQPHPQPPNENPPETSDSTKPIPDIKPEPSTQPNDPITATSTTNPPFPGDATTMDFDSMFPPGSGDATNLDMTMDFPSDEAGDQNFLAANNLFGTSDTTNNQNNQPKPQDTMNSLLPGLENYANAAGELTMNPTMGNDSSAQISPTRKDSMSNIPPGESNFDDLFMDAGSFAGGAGGGGAGEDLLNDDALVEIGDLDDSWLD
ncbi:hypothetical protein FQN54_006642 [Arachnomyces sp. PD_36]|nr:hypothetical protein FQN54_006642 [Arachnomyces sp. PD_36]